MNTLRARDIIEEILTMAGVRVNGSNPWDMQVYNDNFFGEALSGGSLKVGEAYVAKWWDSPQLDEFFSRVLRAPAHHYLQRNWQEIFYLLLTRIFNFQRASLSGHFVRKHYNLGNDLFVNMLDKRLVYTCAYWRDAKDLDDAQEKKLDLTCMKLGLQPGMRVLDIGCGWGSFAKFAAEKYNVSVTGITLSEKQMKFATTSCSGLPVNIQLVDYRDVRGKFDRIVSLGMFEHVGYKNYRRYMAVVNKCLADDGLFLLHTIGSNHTTTWTDPWLDRYIFPGTMLPSVAQIAKSIEGLFVMEDWHNFSADYDKTLVAWYQKFVANWESLKPNYDDRFFRMWKYYLLSCAGSFRARKNQLWQIVLSKKGVPGGYHSIR